MTDHNVMRQVLARAVNGIKMVVGRGRVLLTIDNDQGPVQKVQAQVSAKEVMDLLRVAEFGFTSRLPKDSDVAIVFINGDRSNGIIVASNHQTYRLKLENDGEMAVYDAFGKSIWLKKTGGIVVEANGQPVTVNNAKGLLINTTDDVVLNMGGKNVTINNPGTVELSGAGGKKVALDGDSVVAGKVVSSATKVFAS